MTQTAHEKPDTATDLLSYARKCYQDGKRDELAKLWSLPEWALATFGLGYDADEDAWVAPAFDEHGQVQDVVRMPRNGGKQSNLSDGCRCLFMPPQTWPVESRSFLFICETLQDAASVVSAGNNALAKVRTIQDTDVVSEVAFRGGFKGAVVCHDRIEGNPLGRLRQRYQADILACGLALDCPTIEYCRVIEPPDGHTTLHSLIQGKRDRMGRLMELATAAPEWAQGRPTQ